MRRGAVLALAACALALPVSARGQVPAMMNHQGVLTTSGGTPLADGAYDLAFALYATASEPAPLWTETVPGVAVQDGFYSAVLGATTPFPAGVFRDHAELWLGVRVGAGGDELPRGRLLTVGYAFEAQHAIAATAAATATIAQGLSCTGCIPDSALGFDLDAAIAAGATTACYDTPEELRAALDAVYVRRGEPFDAGSLPADGIGALSNGILTNVFTKTVALAGVPVAVPNGSVSGVAVDLPIEESGTLRKLWVRVKVEHPAPVELKVVLLEPLGPSLRVLHDHGMGDAGGLDRTWPPAALVAGTFDDLLGRNPTGIWTLKVIDDVAAGGNAGRIAAYEIGYEVLRPDHVDVKGTLTVGGTDVGATLAAHGADLDRAFKVGGDAADGVLDVASGITKLAAGVYEYESIRIGPGATLTLAAPSTLPLYLRSRGDCVIDGTIDLRGLGAPGGSGGSRCTSGTGDDGSPGSDGINGIDDQPRAGAGGDWVSGSPPPGGAGAKALVPAGSEGKLSPVFVALTRRLPFGVGAGGGGGASVRRAVAGAGGSGGGSLVIECAGAVTFRGQIDVRGADGGKAVEIPTCQYTGYCAGGGGGGAGGIATVAGSSFAVSTGTALVAGGAGGAQACNDGSSSAGGAGGDGRFVPIDWSRLN